MSDISNIFKKFVIGFGIIALSISSLDAQKSKSYYLRKAEDNSYCSTKSAKRYERSFFNRNMPIVKVGATYNYVNADNLTYTGPGIEFMMEDKLSKRLFVEWDIGACTFYDYKARNGNLRYSQAQTNIGMGYKPIIWDGWEIGGKAAVGVSNEFYKRIENPPFEGSYFEKLVELNAEKTFRSRTGAYFLVSREIDRNIWKIGAGMILNSGNNRPYNHSNRKSSR